MVWGCRALSAVLGLHGAVEEFWTPVPPLEKCPPTPESHCGCPSACSPSSSPRSLAEQGCTQLRHGLNLLYCWRLGQAPPCV